MKKILFILFTLFLLISCSDTKESIIYDNNCDIYYENTFYYYKFSDLNFYIPLISKKDIKKIDNNKFYNDEKEIEFSTISNNIHLQETNDPNHKSNKYQGYVYIYLDSPNLINYHFDKIEIKTGDLTFNLNVDIDLINDEFIAKENSSIFLMSYNYGLLDNHFVSYYILDTNSDEILINEITNINDKFKISKIERSSIPNTNTILNLNQLSNLNYQEFKPNSSFNTQSSYYDLIKIEYEEYADSFLFEDIILISGTCNSFNTKILSSGVTIIKYSVYEIEDFICC